MKRAGPRVAIPRVATIATTIESTDATAITTGSELTLKLVRKSVSRVAREPTW